MDGQAAARELPIALAQINPTVGDLEGNRRRMEAALDEARRLGAGLVVFPEMALTGCPPEDLVLRRDFLASVEQALAALAPAARGLVAVVGSVCPGEEGVWNGACLLHDGRPAGAVGKARLAARGVFDEPRYFSPGIGTLRFRAGSVSAVLCVGEDLWHADPRSLRDGDLIVHLGAFPFVRGEGEARERRVAARAKELGLPIVSCHLVGGQDELVFGGRSVAVDAQGRVVGRARSFREDLLLVTGSGAPPDRAGSLAPVPGPLEEVYEALVLGLGDYVRKNGFREVVLGLSGGLDSALVAALAADALGPDRVIGVGMPTRYTSEPSREDARQLAERLGIRYLEVDIDGVFQSFLDALAPVFRDAAPDVTEENLQPRIRGTLLMALSNKFGWLVLAAGNKSEAGVGYSTLYGDTVGGLAPLRDVPKTLVYELARYRNGIAGRDLIPERILSKPPSAELRPDQKDTDTLPDYPVLDPVLQGFVEEGLSVEELVERGFDPGVVRRVVGMVERNEYKRRQGPPGVKISPRAFGKDWRMPLTNGYRSG